MHKLRFTTVAKLVIILLILLLIPLSAFNLPKSQMLLEGFDPKLIDIDTPSGVTLNASMLVFVAKPNEADPSITTVTSPASFTINVEATVIKQAGEVHPLHISIWDKTAATNDAFSIYFDSPSNKIVYDVVNSTNQLEVEVSKYTQNCPYDIRISFSANSCLDFSIANSTWSSEPVTLNPANATILKRPMVSLHFFAPQYAQGGESVAVLQKYQVEFPSQDYFVFFTNLLGVNLNFVYVILFAAIVIIWRNDFSEAFNRTTSFSRRIGNRIRHGSKEAKLMAILFFSSVLLQVCISFLGSQPYDSFAQKTWAYINTKYGLEYLYPLSNIAPSGRSVGTLSIINLGYPYPPLLGYIYLLVGRIYSVVSPTFDLNAPLFGLLMKTPWILATSALGLLIYYFTRKTYSAKVAFVLASLYLFNPCVIFESTIWSQSDAILASFLILAVLSLLSNSKCSVWFFLGLSLLTKQTAVVPAAFIAFFALRQFGVRKGIESLVFPFACIFLFVSPYLFLGYSPSFIFNVSVGQNVLNMLGTPQRVAEWQIAASGGAHNIWPILTRLLADQSGWLRFAYPYQSSALMSRLASFGTYVVLICFALIIVQSLISEKPKNTKESPTFYMLFLVVLSLYTFFTRMQTRYLYLTIPFLILSFAWIRNRKVFALLFGTLTTTFFLSDYSYFTLTSVWQPAFLPNFSPNANVLNSTMFLFVTNDTFITVLCLANLSLFILAMLFSNYRILFSNIHIERRKILMEKEKSQA